MKNVLTLGFLFFVLQPCVIAQNVGIGTESPQAVLDVNGDVIFRPIELLISDTSNYVLDINTYKFAYYRITGPANDFHLAGISAGVDGRVITLINRSNFIMELRHQNAETSPESQISTSSLESVLIEDKGLVSLYYDSTEQRWIVMNVAKAVNTVMGWDTSGTNVFYNNNVGIGTSEPTSPLTIQTELNEVGFSQVNPDNSTVLSSSLTDIGATMGTTTENVFSLNAGSNGKLHVLPDGRVVIGEDADPSNFTSGNNSSRMTQIDAKLTLETPINSTGWIHVGGTDSIIVQEAIGGVSASLGTATNHPFRLNANSDGKLHLYPDGNVVIGNNVQGAAARFTVHTPENTNGIAQVGSGGQVLAMRIGGSSATIGTHTPHIMRIVANNIAAINIDPFGNVAIGTPDALAGYKLSVNGSIKARELVIETIGWPDYVFAENYKPLPLSEVEKFIQSHHHLPNIPSASEIEKNGVAVGEMQKKMMEKIEELTLHIIELNKRIELLEDQDQH